jgi:iron(III) transport system ATP-binding protein
MTAQGLVVRGLTKRFGASEQSAVADVDLTVGPGEFFTMLGPSGCGKTTTLRMIAGLETATSGAIVFSGQDFTAVPARQRNIGMVFQSYALFPHLSVFENVAYGLRLRGLAADEIGARAREVLALLQLDSLADRLPASLSGGQQQRVSIARALVYRPHLLLLDEPLANLDAKLRVHMREEIRRLQRRLGIMAIYVTHDQEEAMAISDRIAVFNRGRLMQVGPPAEVYMNPASMFVADFIGKANFLPARLIGRANGADGGAAVIATPWHASLTVSRVAVADEVTLIPAGSDGALMLRPERLVLDAAQGPIAGRIERVQFLGAIVRYAVSATGAMGEIVVETGRPVAGLGEGDSCRLSFAAEDALLFLGPQVLGAQVLGAQVLGAQAS